MRRLAALALVAGPLAGTPAHPVWAKVTVISQNDRCGTQTLKEERKLGIPQHLLRSISLAETGRYDPQSRVSFAWPWTVTSGGEGKYFNTKIEAIQAVQRLQAAGVKNIDVGCMQINLFYHPNAFASLNEAFDPAANVGYASRFLAELKNQTGSWIEATGQYHSADPMKSQAYRKKVLALWKRVRGGKSPGGYQDLVADVDPNDLAKRALLQQRALEMRFRARLAAERTIAGRDKHQKQLDDWRIGRGNPELLANQAARRRAERLAKLSNSTDRSEVDFAAKRREQLAKWRERNGHLQQTAAADPASTAVGAPPGTAPHALPKSTQDALAAAAPGLTRAAARRRAQIAKWRAENGYLGSAAAKNAARAKRAAEAAAKMVSQNADNLRGAKVNQIIGDVSRRLPGYIPPKAPDLGLLK